MRNLKLEYSLNGGSTWTTAKASLPCLSVRCVLLPQFETEGSENRTSDGVICQKTTSRHFLTIVVSPAVFDPTKNASATSEFIAVQKWCCAPLRRLANVDVATNATIDGWDLWDTDPNTNYVVLDGEPDVEFQDMDTNTTTGRRVRRMTIKLMTRSKYTLS